jgi:hypothetical protein
MFRAHPTTYGGTQFRSRLEARWAAFFDLAQWRWEYEPSDDAGWVPDFILVDSGVAVEVKPIEWTETTAFRDACERPDLEKVRKSERLEALILGAYPVGSVSIGVFYGKFEDWPPLTFGRLYWRDSTHRIDLSSGTYDGYSWSNGSWRASGDGMFREMGKLLEQWELDQMWREAGNRVQWRRPAA